MERLSTIVPNYSASYGQCPVFTLDPNETNKVFFTLNLTFVGTTTVLSEAKVFFVCGRVFAADRRWLELEVEHIYRNCAMAHVASSFIYGPLQHATPLVRVSIEDIADHLGFYPAPPEYQIPLQPPPQRSPSPPELILRPSSPSGGSSDQTRYRNFGPHLPSSSSAINKQPQADWDSADEEQPPTSSSSAPPPLKRFCKPDCKFEGQTTEADDAHPEQSPRGTEEGSCGTITLSSEDEDEEEGTNVNFAAESLKE